MKKLADGTQIPDRVWYYVLDYRDKNLTAFEKEYGSVSLTTLTQSQFILYYHGAVTTDLLYLSTQK